MFNRNSSDALTKAEAQAYAGELRSEALNTFVSKEDAQAYAEALKALDDRVTTLEALASELRRNGTPAAASADERDETAEQPRRTEVRGSYDGITGGSRASAPARAVASTTGVDYGAIAFGLAEIKRNVVAQFGHEREVATKFVGTVQYFADVFAKSDPNFDQAMFKRQSGV